MKNLIYLLVLFTFLPSKSQILRGEGATLHMIIFAATDDESIGESCNTDFENIKSLGYEISDGTGMRIKKYFYKASTNKKKQMQSVLENLNADSNDVVYFYYSGHGYRAENSQSPYPRMYITDNGSFSQNNQGISVEYVRQQIKKARPRLGIIMVDACNTMIGIKEPESGISGEIDYRKQLKRLFLESKGEIVICGSEAGDGQDNSGYYTGYSWSNGQDGGFFTHNFINEFYRAIKSSYSANWDDILYNTKLQTKLYSKARLSDNPKGNDIQIPVYEYNKKGY